MDTDQSTSSSSGPACPASAPPSTSDANAPARPTRCWRPGVPSAAPGTCSATRASAPTPTCTPSATHSSWTDPKAIADGDSIRAYVRQTAREYDVERHIRFHHRAVRAEWDSATARWTVHAHRDDTGEDVTSPAGSCSPTPATTATTRLHAAVPGVERYAGTLVHPQHWPEHLDHTGKRVVVIGSGATAVTLVPAMAERAAHVTMLQRSPTYVIALPSRDPFADAARLPPAPRTRWPGGRTSRSAWRTSSSRCGEAVPAPRREGPAPSGYDVDRHFSPRYNRGTSGSAWCRTGTCSPR
ncbi:hypothetical protein V2I01_37125 [Micromonospora sp. BRA006-A]|nr:hypothetical protein [Micromonospora sp. BRA006-A]